MAAPSVVGVVSVGAAAGGWVMAQTELIDSTGGLLGALFGAGVVGVCLKIIHALSLKQVEAGEQREKKLQAQLDARDRRITDLVNALIAAKVEIPAEIQVTVKDETKH